MLAKREAQQTDPLTEPHKLRARTKAEERSGVRRIRIRHHQILSDSPPDFAGYDLGPASPAPGQPAVQPAVRHRPGRPDRQSGGDPTASGPLSGFLARCAATVMTTTDVRTMPAPT